MKRVFLIAGFSIASIAVYANVNDQISETVVIIEEVANDGKVEIKASELPRNVLEALGQSKIEKAFRLTDTDGNISGYEVIVNNGESNLTILFDKEGNAVE